MSPLMDQESSLEPSSSTLVSISTPQRGSKISADGVGRASPNGSFLVVVETLRSSGWRTLRPRSISFAYVITLKKSTAAMN